jgi:translation initiation factor 1 (eIF-1/SUI1)
LTGDTLDETTERVARRNEEALRIRKMWVAVILAALDDAISDNEHRPGVGVVRIIRWARSRDGRTVLTLAGLEPGETTVSSLANFVKRGVRTATALSLRNLDRKETL